MFPCWEHDQHILAALVPTDAANNRFPKQQEQFVLNGFDNKTLNRLLMMQEDLSVTSDNYGSLGSAFQQNQKVQVVVNGKNLLPRSGITKPMQSLAHHADVAGPTLNYLSASDGINPDLSDVLDSSGNSKRSGQLAYTMVRVDEPIVELQVNYERTGEFVTGASDQKLVKPNTSLMLGGALAQIIFQLVSCHFISYFLFSNNIFISIFIIDLKKYLYYITFHTIFIDPPFNFNFNSDS